jgi:hypothetical protein
MPSVNDASKLIQLFNIPMGCSRKSCEFERRPAELGDVEIKVGYC